MAGVSGTTASITTAQTQVNNAQAAYEKALDADRAEDAQAYTAEANYEQLQGSWSSLNGTWSGLQSKADAAGNVYESQIDSIERQLRSSGTFQSRLTSAQAELADATSDAKTLAASATAAEKRAADQLKLMGAADKDATTKQAAYTTAQKTADATKTALDAANRSVTGFEDAYERLAMGSRGTLNNEGVTARAAEAKTDAYAAAKGKVATLQSAYDRADKAFDRAHSALLSANRELASARTELANAKSALRSAQLAYNDDPRAPGALARLNSAKARVNTAQSRFNSASSKAASARSTEDRAAVVQERALQALQAAKRAAEAARKAMEAAKEAAERAREAAEKARKAIEAARKRMEEAQAKAEELKAKHAEQQAAASKLKGAAEAALRKAEGLEGSYMRLKQAAGAARSRADEAKTRVGEATAAVDSAKKALDAEKQRKQALLDKAEQLKKTHDDLQAKAEAAKAKADAAKAKVDTAKTTLSKERADAVASQATVDSTNSKLSSAKSALRTAQSKSLAGMPIGERRMMQQENTDAAREDGSTTNAAGIDKALTAAEIKALKKQQEELDAQLEAAAAASNSSGTAVGGMSGAGMFGAIMDKLKAGVSQNQLSSREKEILKSYYTTHDYYIDKDGTAYNASYNQFTNQVVLVRNDEQLGTDKRGASWNQDTNIKIEGDGARETETRVETNAGTLPNGGYEAHTESVKTDRTGAFTGAKVTDTTAANKPDGTRVTDSQSATYDKSKTLTNVTATNTVAKGATTDTTSRSQDLTADGKVSRYTEQHDLTEPGHDLSEKTVIDFWSDGTTPRDQSYDLREHTDAKGDTPASDATYHADTQFTGAGVPIVTKSNGEFKQGDTTQRDWTTLNYGTTGLPTDSHSYTTTDTETKDDAGRPVTVQGRATTDVDYNDKGIRESSHTVGDTNTNAFDEQGRALTIDKHEVTDSQFDHKGDPTRVYTDATTRTDAFDENNKPLVVKDNTTTLLYAGGSALKFGADGMPANFTPVVNSTVSTLMIDPEDDTKTTELVQHGAGADPAKLNWDSLRIVSVDLNDDGSVLLRDAVDFSDAELDENGMPLESAKGTTDESQKVDNRSWWDQNFRNIASGLQIVGGVLAVIPLGVTQVIGGAMLIGGSAMLLSQDLPALIKNPSWEGAMAVGFDVLGGIGGIGSLAGAAARGASATASALNATARGGAVLGEGITGLNLAGKIYKGASLVLNSKPVLVVGGGAMAWQTVGAVDKFFKGELTLEEGIGVVANIATMGVAMRFGANGTVEIPGTGGKPTVLKTKPAGKGDLLVENKAVDGGGTAFNSPDAWVKLSDIQSGAIKPAGAAAGPTLGGGPEITTPATPSVVRNDAATAKLAELAPAAAEFSGRQIDLFKHFTKHRNEFAGEMAIDGVSVRTPQEYLARANEIVEAGRNGADDVRVEALADGKIGVYKQSTGEFVVVTKAGKIDSLHRLGMEKDVRTQQYHMRGSQDWASLSDGTRAADGTLLDVSLTNLDARRASNTAAVAQLDARRAGAGVDPAPHQAQLAKAREALDLAREDTSAAAVQKVANAEFKVRELEAILGTDAEYAAFRRSQLVIDIRTTHPTSAFDAASGAREFDTIAGTVRSAADAELNPGAPAIFSGLFGDSRAAQIGADVAPVNRPDHAFGFVVNGERLEGSFGSVLADGQALVKTADDRVLRVSVDSLLANSMPQLRGIVDSMLDVRVHRSAGGYEGNWRIASLDGTAAEVTVKSADGRQTKRVSPEEFARLNADRAVSVRRSSGAIDDGWFVTGRTGDTVTVFKPGVGSKPVALADLAAGNTNQLFGARIHSPFTRESGAVRVEIQDARQGNKLLGDQFTLPDHAMLREANYRMQEALANIQQKFDIWGVDGKGRGLTVVVNDDSAGRAFQRGNEIHLTSNWAREISDPLLLEHELWHAVSEGTNTQRYSTPAARAIEEFDATLGAALGNENWTWGNVMDLASRESGRVVTSYEEYLASIGHQDGDGATGRHRRAAFLAEPFVALQQESGWALARELFVTVKRSGSADSIEVRAHGIREAAGWLWGHDSDAYRTVDAALNRVGMTAGKQPEIGRLDMLNGPSMIINRER